MNSAQQEKKTRPMRKTAIEMCSLYQSKVQSNREPRYVAMDENFNCIQQKGNLTVQFKSWTVSVATKLRKLGEAVVNR